MLSHVSGCKINSRSADADDGRRGWAFWTLPRGCSLYGVLEHGGNENSGKAAKSSKVSSKYEESKKKTTSESTPSNAQAIFAWRWSARSTGVLSTCYLRYLARLIVEKST